MNNSTPNAQTPDLKKAAQAAGLPADLTEHLATMSADKLTIISKWLKGNIAASEPGAPAELVELDKIFNAEFDAGA